MNPPFRAERALAIVERKRKNDASAQKDLGLRAKDRGRMKKKVESQSQPIELFLHVAELLGCTADRDIAELAGVSVENVGNWRSGAVKEFKPGKLKAIKDALSTRVLELKAKAGAVDASHAQGLVPVEIELGSGPADLQKQFRDRVSWDYIGHRFLYFDPMGALAWENLVRGGYEQDQWVRGSESSALTWSDATKDGEGRSKGPIAEALGACRRGPPVALDFLSLGPGDGEKELAILRVLLDLLKRSASERPIELTYVPIDVSIPLLLTGSHAARKLFAQQGAGDVLSLCADFEEGRLGFVDRLPTARRPDSMPGLRLIAMLGNVFGNLRDEEAFIRNKLYAIARPKDLVWLEVGIRPEQKEQDPLYRLTQPEREETSAEANRRLLLEGPYRRWESASGRAPSVLGMRIWVREDDDSCRVPGSINFCHDLVIKDERDRVCTMLYSRRYQIEGLVQTLERLEFAVLGTIRVSDSKKRPRVLHLLLERK
jgi:histidine-specific SAM-dependent methyltransferase